MRDQPHFSIPCDLIEHVRSHIFPVDAGVPDAYRGDCEIPAGGQIEKRTFKGIDFFPSDVVPSGNITTLTPLSILSSITPIASTAFFIDSLLIKTVPAKFAIHLRIPVIASS